ncbi:P-loop containing nucleoside triphosphate hydrolase [Vibrio phage 1.262.O._10N.286.51.A9]|nr:P-loop containing nucleoside triphosphate hydrolase [Vibrio phage 1.262.O._10N.286.51.A9]
MGKVVGDTACPECRKNGGDKTGNHLMLFEDGNGYCNRCGHHHYKDKDGELKPIPRIQKTPEQVEAELAEVKTYKYLPLTSRAISLETATKTGIRTAVSEFDGKTPIQHYYPYTRDDGKTLSGYNVRILSKKKFYGVGNRKEVDPFNWSNARRVATRQRIIIAEDELSTASVVEVFDKFTKDKQWVPAVIGLATSPQGILQELGRDYIKDFILEFDEVIFALDNDEAGKEGLELGLKLFPDAKFVELPKKDPNDMKMAGLDIELFNALAFNPKRKQPSGSLTLSDMKERMMADVQVGLSYPWEKMTRHTNGLLWGQVITLASGVGLGKTYLANTISAWFNKQHAIKSGMIMLEQPAEESGRAIVGSMTGQQFNNPKIPMNKERLADAIDKVGDDFYFYDAVRNADWDEIKPVIRHWVLVEGVKIIQLDNLTTLTAHLDSASANQEINRIMAELAMMCKKYEFSAFVYSHLNPPKTGDAHEEGGEVKETQMTGSRGAMRYSSYVLGFERNRNAGLSPEEQNLSRLRILKCRPIGSTPGIVGLEFDIVTGLMVQREEMHLPKSPKIIEGGI